MQQSINPFLRSGKSTNIAPKNTNNMNNETSTVSFSGGTAKKNNGPNEGTANARKKSERMHVLIDPAMYISSLVIADSPEIGLDDNYNLIFYNQNDGYFQSKNVPLSKGLIQLGIEAFSNGKDNYYRTLKSNTTKYNTDIGDFLDVSNTRYLELSRKEINNMLFTNEIPNYYVHMDIDTYGIWTVKNNGNTINLKATMEIPSFTGETVKILQAEGIFGIMMSGTSYNDEMKTDFYDYVVSGMHGVGIKLANLFSVYMQVTIGNGVQKQKMTLAWKDNMREQTKPLSHLDLISKYNLIKRTMNSSQAQASAVDNKYSTDIAYDGFRGIIEKYDGENFVEVKFLPDYKRMQLKELPNDGVYESIMRLQMFLSALYLPYVEFKLNGKLILNRKDMLPNIDNVFNRGFEIMQKEKVDLRKIINVSNIPPSIRFLPNVHENIVLYANIKLYPGNGNKILMLNGLSHVIAAGNHKLFGDLIKNLKSALSKSIGSEDVNIDKIFKQMLTMATKEKEKKKDENTNNKKEKDPREKLIELIRKDIQDGYDMIIYMTVFKPKFEKQEKNDLNIAQKDFYIDPKAIEAVIQTNLEYYKKQFENILNEESNRKHKERNANERITGKPSFLAKLHDANKASLYGRKHLNSQDQQTLNKLQLIVVEGDSAASSNLLQSIDNDITAVLPLKGKTKNVTESGEKLMDPVLQQIADALRLPHHRVTDPIDRNTLVYKKIIVMTDADPDGQHIVILIVNFFYQFYPDLLKVEFDSNGRKIKDSILYVLTSPLFLMWDNDTKVNEFFSNYEYSKYMDDHWGWESGDQNETKINIPEGHEYKVIQNKNGYTLHQATDHQNKNKLTKTNHEFKTLDELKGFILGNKAKTRNADIAGTTYIDRIFVPTGEIYKFKIEYIKGLGTLPEMVLDELFNVNLPQMINTVQIYYEQKYADPFYINLHDDDAINLALAKKALKDDDGLDDDDFLEDFNFMKKDDNNQRDMENINDSKKRLDEFSRNPANMRKYILLMMLNPVNGLKVDVLEQLIGYIKNKTSITQMHSYANIKSTVTSRIEEQIKIIEKRRNRATKKSQDVFDDDDNIQTQHLLEDFGEDDDPDVQQLKSFLEAIEHDHTMLMNNYVRLSKLIFMSLYVYSTYNILRSIPSLMDGLKPSMRKVLYTLFTNNTNRIGVGQLGGLTKTMTDYKHGEKSLEDTIIKNAQSFAGSNNLPPLENKAGSFGSFLEGGKDSAHSRYIYTCLAPHLKLLYPSEDNDILYYPNSSLTYTEILSTYKFSDKPIYNDEHVDPITYYGVLPPSLINGNFGIGTGWQSNSPSYAFQTIVNQMKDAIHGELKYNLLHPVYRGWQGNMLYYMDMKYGRAHYLMVPSVIKEVNSTEIRYSIRHLPPGCWTNDLVRKFKAGLAKISNKDEDFIKKNPEFNAILDYGREQKSEDIYIIIEKAANFNIGKFVFKHCSKWIDFNPVLLDHNNRIREYNNPNDIIKEFVKIRLEVYAKRKEFKLSKILFDIELNKNLLKFIIIYKDDQSYNKLSNNDKYKWLKGKDLAEISTFPKVQSALIKPITIDENKKIGEYQYITGRTLDTLTGETAVSDIEKILAKLDEQYTKLSQITLEKMFLDDIEKLEDFIKKYVVDNNKKTKNKKSLGDKYVEMYTELLKGEDSIKYIKCTNKESVRGYIESSDGMYKS